MSKTAVTAASKEAKRALGKMTPALRKVFDKISDKLRNLARVDILSRYDLGTQIQTAMGDDRKYGEQVAETLAAALSINISQIYAWKSVASMYSKEEIQELIDRKMTNDGSITFTHLTLLAGCHKAQLRNKVTNAVFKDCLTSRDLLALIKENMDRTSNRAAGAQRPRSPAAALAKFSKMTTALMEEQSGLEETLFESLSSEPGKYATDKLEEQLEDTALELSQLSKMVKSDTQKISAALDSVRRALRAKEAEDVDTDATPERLRTKKKTTKTKPESSSKNSSQGKAAAAKERLMGGTTTPTKKKKKKRKPVPA